MQQHNDLTGEAAVDLLVSLTTAGKEPLSLSPRGILITPTWKSGETLYDRQPQPPLRKALLREKCGPG
jgi:LacI family transcriptional regulator